MAYSDDAVRAKLASLNETQDSIVANAQWIMFHRRHAARTASLWLEKLRSAPTPRRLNLIYLANEVVQQSRARGKQDFLLAFEPLIAEAVGTAYKGASVEVQGKVRRVVGVWRERGIFEPGVLGAVEGRLGEMDRARGGGGTGEGGIGKAKLGGSLFGGVPQELEGVGRKFAELGRTEAGKEGVVMSAQGEWTKLTDAANPLPTPPVHAARLSALMRSLATAQGAVEASIRARKDVLSELEKLVSSHRDKLAADAESMTDLSAKKEGIEAKKKEVEDGIMRGLSAPTSPAGVDTPPSAGLLTPLLNGNGNGNGEVAKEELSAPSPEGFTPPPTLEAEDLAGQEALLSTDPAAPIQDPTATEHHPPLPTDFPQPSSHPTPPIPDAATAANDFLASLSLPLALPTATATSFTPTETGTVRQASGEVPSTVDPRLKRRKLSHKSEGDGGELGVEIGGVDEEGVAAMLGS